MRLLLDWYDSSWFGTFFQMKDGWAYHLEFGWIYPIIKMDKTFGFGMSKHGWIWLNEESFSNQYMWVK